MKKIFIILFMIVGFFAFADGKDNEPMTWAEYELLKGEDANYDDYIALMKQGGQCYGDSEENVLKLFQQN